MFYFVLFMLGNAVAYSFKNNPLRYSNGLTAIGVGLFLIGYTIGHII